MPRYGQATLSGKLIVDRYYIFRVSSCILDPRFISSTHIFTNRILAVSTRAGSLWICKITLAAREPGLSVFAAGGIGRRVEADEFGVGASDGDASKNHRGNTRNPVRERSDVVHCISPNSGHELLGLQDTVEELTHNDEKRHDVSRHTCVGAARFRQHHFGTRKNEQSYLIATIHWPQDVENRWNIIIIRNVYPAGVPSGSPTMK